MGKPEMLTNQLKGWLKQQRILQPGIQWIQRTRNQRLVRTIYQENFISQTGETITAFQTRIANQLYQSPRDIRVLSGPFQGMKCLNATCWDLPTSKWIGSYEDELHSLLDRLLSKEYQCVMNIGSAEGYYAVGFALRRIAEEIRAYDCDRRSRQLTRQLANANQVGPQIAIEKKCDRRDFDRHLRSLSLVICDIEGAEYELLCPKMSPSLRNADILVEVHSWRDMSPTRVEEVLISRFNKTHYHRVLTTQEKDAQHYAEVTKGTVKHEDLLVCLNEQRHGEMHWIHFEAR